MARTSSRSEDMKFTQELKENFEFAELDCTWVLQWVQENFDPGDIFDEEELTRWAMENGFERSER